VLGRPQDKILGEATELVIGADNVLPEHVRSSAPQAAAAPDDDDNFIMNGVHIARDVQIDSHVIVAARWRSGADQDFA
jgi:acyl-[acyl carrier protein]--UDP-N-acetylglucosamine O-acyltransferase